MPNNYLHGGTKRIYSFRKDFGQIPCPICAAPFTRTTPTQVVCSPECREVRKKLRLANRIAISVLIVLSGWLYYDSRLDAQVEAASMAWLLSSR